MPKSLTHSLDELIVPSDVIELAEVGVVLHMSENSFDGFLAGGLVKAEQEEVSSNDADGTKFPFSDFFRRGTYSGRRLYIETKGSLWRR